MRFVDVKNDVAFRKIFGNENKTQILISFLNAILELEGNQQIKEVSIVNPYQLPRVRGEKASIIDVRAIDKRGHQFIVEMQVASVDGFDKRIQYYTCRDYSMQIDRGEQYPLLKPTHFIGILDFDFFESSDYLSHHIIVNGKTYEHKLKDIQFRFIELGKFNKEIQQLETLIEKWVFFIKNAENLEVIPENIDDEGLMEAYNDAEKHNWTKEELKDYDNASIAEQDARGKLIAAKKEGKEEGRIEGKKEGKIEGKKEGKMEGKIEVIEVCLQQNLSPEAIAKLVRLPIDEVQKIITQLDA